MAVYVLSSILLLSLRATNASPLTPSTSPGWSGKTTDYNFAVEDLVALGDSFSAGPTAGRAYEDPNYCGRWTGSVAQQLFESDELRRTSVPRLFEFVSCTGAVVDDMLNEKTKNGHTLRPQVQDFGSAADMITLSISGNDLGFSTILERCILGIFPSTRICRDELDLGRSKLNAESFEQRYLQVLARIRDNGPQSHIYVTGYPRFFNDESDQCNHVAWGANPACDDHEHCDNLFEWKRKAMNQLVDDLNSKIFEIVRLTMQTPGPPVRFVDPNPYYDGHRFCEEGVTEPDYNRPNTWFYHWTFSKRPWSEFTLAGSCDPEGDWGEYMSCGLNERVAEDPALLDYLYNAPLAREEPTPDGGWIGVPEMFQRMFHPTILGHLAIKNAIIAAYKGPFAEVGSPDSPNDGPLVEPPTTLPTELSEQEP